MTIQSLFGPLIAHLIAELMLIWATLPPCGVALYFLLKNPLIPREG